MLIRIVVSWLYLFLIMRKVRKAMCKNSNEGKKKNEVNNGEMENMKNVAESTKKDKKVLKNESNNGIISSHKEYESKIEKQKGVFKMATLTADCNLAFVVKENKSKDFLAVKADEKAEKKFAKMAEEVRKNIIIGTDSDGDIK